MNSRGVRGFSRRMGVFLEGACCRGWRGSRPSASRRQRCPCRSLQSKKPFISHFCCTATCAMTATLSRRSARSFQASTPQACAPSKPIEVTAHIDFPGLTLLSLKRYAPWFLEELKPLVDRRQVVMAGCQYAASHALASDEESDLVASRVSMELMRRELQSDCATFFPQEIVFHPQMPHIMNQIGVRRLIVMPDGWATAARAGDRRQRGGCLSLDFAQSGSVSSRRITIRMPTVASSWPVAISSSSVTSPPTSPRSRLAQR